MYCTYIYSILVYFHILNIQIRIMSPSENIKKRRFFTVNSSKHQSGRVQQFLLPHNIDLNHEIPYSQAINVFLS